MGDDAMIDAHAHVWDRSCHMISGARYHPDYEATVDDFLRLMDRHGIGGAVLVQPSFLGTDNSYLMRALDDHGDRFRGIVVLDPGAELGEMQDMAGEGVIGMRMNLFHQPVTTIEEEPWQDLMARAARINWWVEVHAEAEDWEVVVPSVSEVRLMIDHFGRPSGPDCPGLAALLTRAPENTCVKLSAPYRLPPQAGHVARTLIDYFGIDRSLWGSDWPWTQNEGQHDYGDCLRWLDDWITREERTALRASVPRLTGFADL